MSGHKQNITIYKESGIFGESSLYSEESFAEDEIGFSEDTDIKVVPISEKTLFSEGDILEFEEEGDGVSVFEEDLEDITLEEALGPIVDGEGNLEDIAEEATEIHEDFKEMLDEHGDMPLSDLLPGSEVSSKDLDDDDDEKETDYENDKDLSKFMDFVSDQYPGKIPKHDGTSTVGCERAISFLDRLNGNISKAIREDHESILDIAKLEDVRLNIMRDVLVLKDHLSKLKKQIKDSHSKKASIPDWKSPSGASVSYEELRRREELRKIAATPNNLVIAVSPFERAISGMMINAHVSSGHPMEEVYASLKKKYDLTDREELSIMQLCMDSGFHIFKDRGSYSEEPAGDGEKRGIDFVRNYFA